MLFMLCGRCNKETDTVKGSFFDTKTICIECQQKEVAHPMYAEAKEREHKEVLKGNYNYEGIGLPEDLRVVTM